MSDGGKAGDKRDEESKYLVRSGSNQFSRAISRIAVAQVCESIGFEGFNESALDSLADIVIRYIFDLGKTSKSYANLAGRTECNVFDIIKGFEDLGMSQGFSGAAEVHTDCVVNSGSIIEIKEYVELAEEIPFDQPVPRYPVIKERKLIPSFFKMCEEPSLKHVPSWLPAFPDPHTYIQTPVWNERDSDPRTDKIQLGKQRRKAESSLLNLQKRLLCNGASVPEAWGEPYDNRNGFKIHEMENPFLAKPLVDIEKDVSLVEPVKLSNEAPLEKRVSLLETFAPAIDAMKDGLEFVNDSEKILSGKRTSIFLEFKGKKVLGESVDFKIRNKASGKTGPWFGHEIEKDDKKRKVEYIIRQSMENQQELP